MLRYIHKVLIHLDAVARIPQLRKPVLQPTAYRVVQERSFHLQLRIGRELYAAIFGQERGTF
jgi:hypothetical protein